MRCLSWITVKKINLSLNDTSQSVRTCFLRINHRPPPVRTNHRSLSRDWLKCSLNLTIHQQIAQRCALTSEQCSVLRIEYPPVSTLPKSCLARPYFRMPLLPIAGVSSPENLWYPLKNPILQYVSMRHPNP